MRPFKIASAAARIRKRPLASLLCLTAFLSALFWGAFYRSTPLGTFNDDAHYYLAATGIARFGRFVDLCLPDHPPRFAYAVGYPLLIAPLVKMFPGSTAPIAFFHFAAFAASAGLVAFLACRLLSLTDAAFVVLAWFLCILPTAMAGAFMSDIPFLACSLTPFALLETAEIGQAAAFGIALSAALALLIRPLGIFLIPALGIQIWSRRTKPEARRIMGWSAGCFAAAVAVSYAFFGYRGLAEMFVPAPLLSGLAASGVAPGLSSLAYMKTVIAGNCVFYAEALLSALLLPQRPVLLSPLVSPLLWALKLLWLPAFAAGFWIQLRRRDGLAIYGALYAAFLVVWFLVDIRYLMPLRPAILLLTLVGFEFWARRWPWTRTLKHLFLAASLYLGAADLWIQWNAPVALDEPKYAWISEHLEPDARIADEIDGTLFLRTNRHAYSYPFDGGRSSREILDSMIAAGVRYYVLYPSMLSVQSSDTQIAEGWHQRQRRALESDIRNPDRFERVFQSASSEIFKLRDVPLEVGSVAKPSSEYLP